VQALTLPSRVRIPRRTKVGAGELNAARVLAVGGVIAYNWWVVVLFVPGLMPSVNGFFSDLEADGRSHAALMSGADLVAGLLMLAALLLRGPMADGGRRREWRWTVVFAAAGALGGHYTYACSEGLSATCRRLEWRLQLPAHHYVHMLSGIAEFAALTTAAVIAMRRTRGHGTPFARIYSGLVAALVVGYPLLAAAYLTDRLGTLVEPIFFVTFSVMVMAEVFEPVGRRAPAAGRVERVDAREAGSAAIGSIRGAVVETSATCCDGA